MSDKKTAAIQDVRDTHEQAIQAMRDFDPNSPLAESAFTAHLAAILRADRLGASDADLTGPLTDH